MIPYLINSKDRLFIAIIIFTAFFIYSPSIRIPFITDEISFVQRNEISTLLNAPNLLKFKEYDGGYYRPIPNLISGIETLSFRYNYSLYRIFNIALHSLAGVLIYLLILKLPINDVQKNLVALFSSLFFITFPINDYSVIWHTDLFDRLMLIFYISGLLVFVKNKFRPDFLSIAFSFLAMLSKEMAFSFPLIAGLLCFCFGSDKNKFKEALFSTFPYLIVAISIILFRWIALGNNIFTITDAHSSGTLTDIIKNYLFFGGLLVFPFYLRSIQELFLLHHILFLIPAIISILIFLIFFVKRRKNLNIVLTFFILFILFTIAPSSRLLMRWYLYLPSIGLSGGLAYFIFSLKFKSSTVPVVIAIIILLIYSGALTYNVFKWVETSNNAITALNNFIKQNKNEIIKDGQADFITIPAKIDDIPVFQLGFDKLFNFYLKSNRPVTVKILTKSYISNFYDSISTSFNKDGIFVKQISDNYFILFNDEENVKFENMLYKNGKLIAVTIGNQEVNNKILYTFSNEIFYKTRGIK
jgi:hypothetical protein